MTVKGQLGGAKAVGRDDWTSRVRHSA
jgi:hypothetical protein